MASTTTLKLPEKLKARIARLAAQSGRSAHSVMLDALGTMCVEGKIGHRKKVMKGAGRMPEISTRKPVAKSAKRKSAARKGKRRRA